MVKSNKSSTKLQSLSFDKERLRDILLFLVKGVVPFYCRKPAQFKLQLALNHKTFPDTSYFKNHFFFKSFK